MRCFVDPPEIYLYRDVVDFRKSINGLAMIVEQDLNRSPFNPALYIFCNRARDKLKILYWDNTGFALWYKRLEKAKFKWPNSLSASSLTLNAQQLTCLLDGYDIVGHQPFFLKNRIN